MHGWLQASIALTIKSKVSKRLNSLLKISLSVTLPAPVVTWTTIRFLLTASLINNWHTRQIDFLLAHPLPGLQNLEHIEVTQACREEQVSEL